MSLNKIRVILLSTSMLLILIVLGFTGAMNMATFKQNFNESLAANYKVLAEQTVRKIEYAVRYGKPLNNFYGIENLLSENLHNVKGIEEVQVVLPGGDIIYNQNGVVVEQQLAADIKEKVHFYQSDSEQDVLYFLDGEHYRVYSPIYDYEGRWLASLGLIFTESVVTSELNQYMYELIYYFIGFSLVTLLVLLLLLYKVPIISSDHKLLKRRISMMIFVILGGIQVTYGAINYVSLKNGYLDLVISNTSLALNVIQSDIEDVINKGVPYSELHGVGDYMKEMIEYLPEVSRISIINADFTTESVNEEIFVSKYSYSVPLIADSIGRENYINVVDLSEAHIDNKMQGILLDTFTIIILAFLLIVEMTKFVLLYLEKRVKKDLVTFTAETTEEMYVRPLSFIVFCAVFLSLSYLPIIMKEFDEPLFGFPTEIILGLPIGLEALFVLITFILASPINHRLGWRTTFIFGVLILTIGSLVSALSWNQMMFILARGVAGTGFGLVLRAIYQYFYRTTGKINVKETFKQFQFGSISGMYFGIVIGAMLAERIGLFNVYFIAIPLFLVAILFALKFMPNRIDKRVIRRRIHYRTTIERQYFLKNKKVVALLLLIITPLAAAGMFLFFFLPVYAHTEKMSIANIGRIFLIQGLLLIYLAPLYTRHVRKFISLNVSMLTSATLIAIGFLLFTTQLNVSSAIIAVVLLGLANSIALTTELEYLKNWNLEIKLEDGKIISYYHSFQWIGKVLGIVLMIACLLLFGHALGIAIIGAVILLSSLLFVIMTRKRINSKERAEVISNEAK